MLPSTRPEAPPERFSLPAPISIFTSAPATAAGAASLMTNSCVSIVLTSGALIENEQARVAACRGSGPRSKATQDDTAQPDTGSYEPEQPAYTGDKSKDPDHDSKDQCANSGRNTISPL